jgi:hypothetical protein
MAGSALMYPRTSASNSSGGVGGTRLFPEQRQQFMHRLGLQGPAFRHGLPVQVIRPLALALAPVRLAQPMLLLREAPNRDVLRFGGLTIPSYTECSSVRNSSAPPPPALWLPADAPPACLPPATAALPATHLRPSPPRRPPPPSPRPWPPRPVHPHRPHPHPPTTGPVKYTANWQAHAEHSEKYDGRQRRRIATSGISVVGR